jgi:hypothetical protein
MQRQCLMLMCCLNLYARSTTTKVSSLKPTTCRMCSGLSLMYSMDRKYSSEASSGQAVIVNAPPGPEVVSPRDAAAQRPDNASLPAESSVQSGAEGKLASTAAASSVHARDLAGVLSLLARSRLELGRHPGTCLSLSNSDFVSFCFHRALSSHQNDTSAGEGQDGEAEAHAVQGLPRLRQNTARNAV